MNKLIFIIVSISALFIGWSLHGSKYSQIYGGYKSDTMSHIAIKNNRDCLLLKLRTELELYSNDTYELNVFTRCQSGSFTKGDFKFEDDKLSFYEKEHHSFEPKDRKLPFWEEVVIGPGVMGRENMTVVPIERANGGFLLFTERAAYLYERVN